MTTNEAISVVIEDIYGNPHELLTDMIYFGRLRLEEEKVEPIIIHNRSGRVVYDLSITAVAHPTAQIGNAADTYLATMLGETDSGPWNNIITIPSIGIDEKIALYVNWTIPSTALLGYGQFAIEITGDVIL